MKKILSLIITTFLLSLSSKAMFVTLYKIDDACAESIGSINADVSNGIFPFTYVWSNGVTETTSSYYSKIDSLSAGSYSLTVYDSGGDSAVASINLFNTSTLDRNGLMSNSLYGITTNMNPGSGSGIGFACPNMNNGAMYALLSETKGAEPFTITNISAPFPGTTAYLGTGVFGAFAGITNLASGDHWYLSVTDNLGCPGNFDDMEYSAGPYPSSPSAILPSCNGQSNGSMYIDHPNASDFPLTITLFDSTSGNFVLTRTLTSFGPQLISNALLPTTYRILMSFGNTIIPCSQNIYATVPDAGTNCGTISGSIYLDTIHNCVLDTSEPVFPYAAVVLTPGPYYASTNGTGTFSAMVPFGTYNVNQIQFSQNYFPVCNSGTATINVVTPNATVSIGDSVNMQYDLSIGLTSAVARPGFNLHYGITVRNNSLITGTSPLITFNVDPSLVFVSCSHPYTNLGGGIYTVQLGAIGGFQSAQISLYFTVPASTPIGSILSSNVSVADVISENIIGNNSASFSQLVFGSFDPNDKTVLPSNDPNNTYFVDIDSMFTYTIRFQNTGNDTAFSIRIVDSLSQWLDINTLEIKAATHPFTWKLRGTGILEFNFDNILLPDSTTDEEASHGSVTYTIRPLNNVPLLSVIPNYAAIYFDFNNAVNTNTITSIIDITVGGNELNYSQPVLMVPNPSGNFIKVLLKAGLQKDKFTLKIFNLQGQEVFKADHIVDQEIISLEQLAGGCYFYHLEKAGKMLDQTKGKIILNR